MTEEAQEARIGRTVQVRTVVGHGEQKLTMGPEKSCISVVVQDITVVMCVCVCFVFHHGNAHDLLFSEEGVCLHQF